jgi:23S rRNA pseudouridine1911/1915/1917 synthase
MQRPMSPSTEHVVTAEESGRRVDRVIATVESVGSRSAAAKLIEDGKVTREGQALRKRDTVTEGERLIVELPERTGAPSEIPAVPFAIVYEDSDLLVVDKPAGLVVHPAPGNRSGTLAQALAGKAAGGDPERPGIVHRLDKETSGLLVVARSDKVLRDLQAALQRREISRRYTALVKGHPESSAGTIDAPLGRDRRNPENISIRQDSERDAITHFEVIEETARRSLLRVQLETGRTHQIRVHLAAIGLPVCGDAQYGGVEGDLGLTRQFLHASELSFHHPVSGELLIFSSSLPADLQAALEKARAER